MRSSLENSPYLTWRSVWATEVVLKDGLCRRVRTGSLILINKDDWIDGILNYLLCTSILSMQNVLVEALIDSNSRMWKEEVIMFTFSREVAKRTLQIPLTWVAHDEQMVWVVNLRGNSLFVMLTNYYRVTLRILILMQYNTILKDFTKLYGD